MPAMTASAAENMDFSVIHRLYNWTLGLAGHQHALAVLALIAFVESSVFPIPPDVLIIPMVLATRQRWIAIAGVCTVASVAGGLAGYGIGYYLYETIGRAIVEFYGYASKFETFQQWYDEFGLMIVFAAGLTPLPYKVFTIASGVASLDIWSFLGGSVVSRGMRFFIVAGLLWHFGEPIRVFIEKHLNTLAVIFTVLLIGSFVVLKYLI
jgi:membrane protein YqaA with SNARE-associated domain